MRTFAVKTFLFAAIIGVIAVSGEVFAQTSTAAAPTVIPVSGRLLTPEGQPRTGPTELVISLYDTHDDAAPRWIEQQQVTLDATGGYSVLFGATLADGLPVDLFTTDGGTRWLGVKAVSDTVEQPRVALLSVPYAAKAASAETLGGKSASEFMLTSTFREDLRTVLEEEGVTNGDGEVGSEAVTLNFLQKGNGSGGTTDSQLFDNGTNVGIGTANPHGQFDVSSNAGAVTNLLIQRYSNDAALSQFLFVKSRSNTIGTWSPTLTGDHFGRFVFAGINASGVRTAGAMVSAAQSGAAGANDVPGALFFSTASVAEGLVERMRITPTGNIGIGTSNPLAMLHVVGNVTVDGNIGAKYQDVAEWVDSAEALDAGSLVVIDTTATNRVTASTKAYDSRVAGAISPQPGLVLGEPGPGRVLVAQSGRVRVKADAQYGAIRPGDLLVSSPTKGHVMRSKPMKAGSHRPGTLIGKALEALPKGQGEILVLLTLQ